MRKIFLVATIVMAFSLLSLYADDPEHIIDSNIPFPFKVERTILPAGQYEAMQLSDDFNTWVIRSLDGKHEVVFLAEVTDSANPASTTELTFERVGNQDYLSGLKISGLEEGWMIPLNELDVNKVAHQTHRVPGKSRARG